ncbi:exgA [Symbiodinium pilosum]|uniref:ExgA protein n=1 Tax=Symbiodinium pilosum TaxID=2952 RepID=A0A812UTV8_SYMPI|nr:exgA [Symbiodinium pilosum]
MAVRIQRLKDSEKDAQDMEKAANAMVLIAAKMATIACRACGTKGGSCNCNEKAFLEAKAAWAAFRHVRGEGKTRDHLKPTAATEYARKLQPATVRHGPGPGPGATEIVTIDDDEDQARDQPQKRPPQTPARSPATPGKRLKAAPATPAPAKKYSVEDEVLHRRQALARRKFDKPIPRNLEGLKKEHALHRRRMKEQRRAERKLKLERRLLKRARKAQQEWEANAGKEEDAEQSHRVEGKEFAKLRALFLAQLQTKRKRRKLLAEYKIDWASFRRMLIWTPRNYREQLRKMRAEKRKARRAKGGKFSDETVQLKPRDFSMPDLTLDEAPEDLRFKRPRKWRSSGAAMKQLVRQRRKEARGSPIRPFLVRDIPVISGKDAKRKMLTYPVLTYPSSVKEEQETDSRLQAAAATEAGETATTTAEDSLQSKGIVAEAAMAIEAGSLRRDMRLDHGLRKVMHSISLAVTSLPACQPTR